MARNCEKKLIGLNRLWLAKQQKDEEESRPKRPHLRSLNSASEVKKWIPGIKKELDYYLDQLSGARKHRYPDTKMKEFEKKVEELENEYKRFVKKVYELDPSTTSVPWQPRGYVSKRKTTDSSQTEVKPKKICTPLLEKEDANSSDVQSGKVRDSADLLFTACSRTTHPSNDTCKINSKNIEGDLEHQRDHIDVGPKHALGLDYDSSSESDDS
ncbi:uncharacterized protein [Pocillopora verrucosa]|uniref:uncharacterized protein n=1 Tax=Pocillopora verrucosa TaxID=203993 RepID=UPI00334207A7